MAITTTTTITAQLAVRARCILASSDRASSLRSVMWLCANFDSLYGAVGEPVDGVRPAYWILTSQAVMERSNMAHAGSLPGDFDPDRVNLKYRETLQEVIQFAANLHMAYTGYQPIVVAIHGLDSIVDASYATLSVAPVGAPVATGSGGKGRSRWLYSMVEPLLCRALAILRDALEHHAGRTGSPYVLCVTLYGEDAKSEPPRYYHVASRWLEDLYECGRDGSVRAVRLREDGGIHASTVMGSMRVP